MRTEILQTAFYQMLPVIEHLLTLSLWWSFIVRLYLLFSSFAHLCRKITITDYSSNVIDIRH